MTGVLAQNSQGRTSQEAQRFSLGEIHHHHKARSRGFYKNSCNGNITHSDCAGFGGKRRVRGAECGKYGVWKRRSVENAGCGNALPVVSIVVVFMINQPDDQLKICISL